MAHYDAVYGSVGRHSEDPAMLIPARHLDLSLFFPASAGRSRPSAWLDALRATRAAEEEMTALAASSTPRRERGRRVFDAAFAPMRPAQR